MTRHRLKDTIYRSELWLIACCTLDEFELWMSARCRKPYHAERRHIAGKSVEYVADDGQQTYAVWLPKWDRTDSDIVTLVHELLHMTSRVLRARGLELVEESEEAYTYFHGMLLEDALRALEVGQPCKSKSTRTRPAGSAGERQGKTIASSQTAANPTHD